ncbi:MAG: NAD-dependent DNA ligase LigA [Pseudoflavonifractor sp.]|nr:NAD-dependent DNA ligase LigA [Pseudoflavonifractor sp.]
METVDPIKDRIERLRDDINRHNYNYYVLSEPEISDYDFDMMMKELEALEKEYPRFDDPYSPTHRVGSDINKSFTQVRHIHPMLSLGNTYTVDEVDEWARRVRDGLMGEPFKIVGELKYDGTSISLIYEDGRLVRAVTRGDGERGDDVTANVMTIKSIPLVLKGSGWPAQFEMRGEILLPWMAFDRLNAEREFNEEPLFANPRNAASGTLKMQNSAEVARRGLDAYLYYMIGDNLPFDNHYDNMMAAREWGFKVAPHITLLDSLDDIDSFIAKWDVERRNLPVATDGLVFKVNNLRQQLNLGYTAKSPRWAIAYKFQAERALTRLRFVSYEVGRTGVITPVANLDPVLLSGTIVKRASLHNEDIIRQLGIHEHDMLYVEKGGEIIPKITGVDEAAREPSASPISFVKECPACGTPLVRVEGEAAWICPNKYGCPPQIVGRIEHYVGRRMMNIDGIGEETSQVMYDAGLVRNIADLYDLEPGQLMALDRFAQKSAERIMQGIEDSKSVPFERVVYALSIPYVGETVAKKLARSLGDMDSLMNAGVEALTAIDDIGPRIAESIQEYFADERNRAVIARLRNAGVQMAVPHDDSVVRSDALAGKTIVISGTFSRHSRDEYKDLIERHGGKNSGSISKKTDFVFAGENMGPAKLEKAQKLGVPIIGEEEFLNMIGED